MFLHLALLISTFYWCSAYVQLMPLLENDEKSQQNSLFDDSQGSFIMNFKVNTSRMF